MPDSARHDDRLTARDLVVDFPQRNGPPVRALTLPHFTAEPGAAWGVRGPSGCGKTTLLHVLAGLLPPTSGTVHWGGSEISGLAEARRDRWRRDTIGIVFQDFHLVPELNALENVLLPDRFRHLRTSQATRQAARALLDGMGVVATRRVDVLSRGEQQRVALARALLHRPRLVLADEPTASLDADTGLAVADLLIETALASGATLVVVSHDPMVLRRLPNILTLGRGA